MPIKLSEGFNKVDSDGINHGYGHEHIEAGHGAEIRNAGFPSVESFVEYVGKNYERICEGEIRKNGVKTFIIELKDRKSNILYIQLLRMDITGQ